MDSCYSFWQGASFLIVAEIFAKEGKKLPSNFFLFSPEALRNFILIAGQNSRGGFVDKPGKNRDFYHTCYSLSGLAFAEDSLEIPELARNHPIYNLSCDSERFVADWIRKNFE